MTTADGVVWKPWWVKYAAFNGVEIRLADSHGNEHIDPFPSEMRYQVGWGPVPHNDAMDWWCDGLECAGRHAEQLWRGGDLDEALAAFHEAEERLLRGEL